MSKVKYSEKLIEEIIKEFPYEILGENLSINEQQPVIYGFRPDLIFNDQNNDIVIVELQINELDRAHIYRCLEYRDLYRIKTKSTKNIRLISFSNKIPTRYKHILATHSIKPVEIDRKELIAKIEILRPDLKITSRKKVKKDYLTIDKIFKGLKRKLKRPNMLNIDGVLFYQQPYKKSYDVYTYDHFVFNIASIKKYPKQFKNDYEAKKNIEVEIPDELIISKNILEIDFQTLRMVKEWTDNLCKYHLGPEKYFDHEVILGYRGFVDDFDYETYIRGSIKTFQPLWVRYSDDRSYNLNKILEDLNLMNTFIFYTGKYPDYTPKKIFESVEVSNSAGKLEENWDEKLKYWISMGKNKDRIDEIVLDHEEKMKRYKWAAIKFKNINTSILSTFDELIWHIDAGHVNYINEKFSINFKKNCHICPIRPKDINFTSIQSLRRSSKYFRHLK